MKPATTMIWDYLVFALFVIASTFVAIYSRVVEGKEKTKADFVFAAGKVSMGAMMLSIARGTLGVRSFLGYPSELYYRGATVWETLYGMVLAYPIVCFVFVPVYYSLGITSVYQYLDLRFKSRLVRCLASGTYIVRQLLNQGVTVYTPCVALYAVIGIPYWVSMLGITLVSVVFTIMGGLKAAILADVMQGITMIAVSVALIIQGCIDAGGVGTVFKTNINGGRLNFLNFDMDPTIRVTTTSALVGQLFMSLSIFGCQQNFVQRYCSMGSQKKVTRTMMCNIPVIIVLFSLSWVVGMVVYSVYVDCDPRKAGYIEKVDEILPFFVADRFNYLPGVMGLFLACLFNGSLSINVSNINSLATVTFEDFLKPIPYLKGLKENHQLYAIKAIGTVYGFIIMGVSFAIGLMSGVIESAMLVTSATSGPLLGVFILAMLVPCCNWKGAAIGMVVSHAVTIWITLGSLTISKVIPELPVSVEGCPNDTESTKIMELLDNLISTTTESTVSTTSHYVLPNITRAEQTDPLVYLYSITYMYYSLLGSIITVALGWIISYLTPVTETDIYDENLLHPTARKIAGWFPGPKRRYAGEAQTCKKFENGGIPEMTHAICNKKDFKIDTAGVSQDIQIQDSECVLRTRL